QPAPSLLPPYATLSGCRWLTGSASVPLADGGVTASPWPDGAGALGLPGMLVVANHVSWIDVLALSAVAPVRLLAKREVGEWPLVDRKSTRQNSVTWPPR